MPNRSAPLREQLREVIRFYHDSPRTEEAYWHWIERYLRFHRRPGGDGRASWRHPREMGATEVRDFLTHLAAGLNVSASTQNQALNALVFLYGEVLQQPLGEFGDFARAKRSARIPVVLTVEEVKAVFAVLDSDYALPLKLLYGNWMRLFEGVRLRVEDLDLARRQIVVRDGKGAKDRVTMVPELLRGDLEVQLARKYPSAPREWAWQWGTALGVHHREHREHRGNRWTEGVAGGQGF